MRQLTKPKHPKIQIGKFFERTFKSVNVPQEFILQSPLQQFKSALESYLILLILRQSFNFKLSSSSSSTFHLDYMNRCTQTCVLESCNLSLRKPTSPQGTQPLLKERNLSSRNATSPQGTQPLLKERNLSSRNSTSTQGTQALLKEFNLYSRNAISTQGTQPLLKERNLSSRNAISPQGI